MRLVRHVLRELWFPTCALAVAFALLLVARDLLASVDLVLNRGLGAGEVAALALARLAPGLVQTLPFAVLVGVLVALGRLAADREWLAMQAAGLSSAQLLVPVLGFATLAAALGIGLSGAVLPGVARDLEARLARVASEHPATALRAGVVRAFGEWRVEAREVSGDGTRLRGVLVYSPDLDETLFARRGELQPDPAGGIRLVLDDGMVLSRAQVDGTQVRFHRMQEHLDDLLPTELGSSELDPLSFGALRALAHDPADPARQRSAALLLQERVARPATALAFAALALPLALLGAGRSRAAGAGLGLAITVLHYGLVQVASGLAHRDDVAPALAAWLPNAVALVAAGALWSSWALRERRPPAQEAARGVRRSANASHRIGGFLLDRYAAARFVQTAALAFGVLLVAYLLVDVLDNSQWFAKYHSSIDEVLRFYGARLPILAARVVPLALLAGAALTVSRLAADGELLAMRACGVSTLRSVVPLVAICALLAAGYGAASDHWLPRANLESSTIKRVEIKNRSRTRTGIWFRAGDRVYQARELDPIAGVASDVVVYELGPDGLPTSRTDATEARHLGHGVWRLEQPLRVEVGGDQVAFAPVSALAELGEDVPAGSEPEQLSVAQLRSDIAAVEAGGYDATERRVDLQARLAAPLACILLPALALLFAANGPPFPSPTWMLVASAGLAALHLALGATSTALGYRGLLAPPLAAWAPAALLSFATLWLALRARGFGAGR